MRRPDAPRAPLGRLLRPILHLAFFALPWNFRHHPRRVLFLGGDGVQHGCGAHTWLCSNLFPQFGHHLVDGLLDLVSDDCVGEVVLLNFANVGAQFVRDCRGERL